MIEQIENKKYVACTLYTVHTVTSENDDEWRTVIGKLIQTVCYGHVRMNIFHNWKIGFSLSIFIQHSTAHKLLYRSAYPLTAHNFYFYTKYLLPILSVSVPPFSIVSFGIWRVLYCACHSRHIWYSLHACRKWDYTRIVWIVMADGSWCHIYDIIRYAKDIENHLSCDYVRMNVNIRVRLMPWIWNFCAGCRGTEYLYIYVQDKRDTNWKKKIKYEEYRFSLMKAKKKIMEKYLKSVRAPKWILQQFQLNARFIHFSVIYFIYTICDKWMASGVRCASSGNGGHFFFLNTRWIHIQWYHM